MQQQRDTFTHEPTAAELAHFGRIVRKIRARTFLPLAACQARAGALLLGCTVAEVC